MRLPRCGRRPPGSPERQARPEHVPGAPVATSTQAMRRSRVQCVRLHDRPTAAARPRGRSGRPPAQRRARAATPPGSTSRLVPWRDRDRPLGVGPDGQAGHAQDRRLLLDAAGVRDHDRRPADEREEVDVAQRVDDPQALARRAGRPPRATGRPRGWSGTTSGHEPRDAVQHRDDACRGRRGRRRWPAGASWPPRTGPRGPAGRRSRPASNRSRLASSVSIIGLPTKWIRSGRDALAPEVGRRPRGWSRTAGPTAGR